MSSADSTKSLLEYLPWLQTRHHVVATAGGSLLDSSRLIEGSAHGVCERRQEGSVARQGVEC